MARLVSIALLLLASTSLVVSLASAKRKELPRLEVKAGNFVDPEGRVVLLRGVNMASKGPNFKLITEASQLDNLPRWGLNLVRLGFNWEAYETNQNEYNKEYLQHYVDVVKYIGERSMYVLVDFHQDAFSRWAVGGCGEGFPEWTVPVELRATPVDQADPAAIAKAGCKDWGIKELWDANVNKMFNRLYESNSDVNLGYLAMITHVAEALKSLSHVVGFDLLNEPINTIKENAKLGPFYANAGKQIRTVIPDAVLFLEPQMTVNLGIIPSFLKKPLEKNVVYAPHFYDGFIHLVNGYYLQSVKFQMGFQYRHAKKWASPYFMGEFGISPTQFAANKYIDDIYSNLDNLWASGAQWGYTPFWNNVVKDGWNLEDYSIVADGEIRSTFNPNRPYVRYVSGVPIRAKIDTKKMTVDVTWTSGENPKGETEIFVPKDFFRGHRHEIEPFPGLECEYRANLFRPDVDDRVVCTVKEPSQKVSLRMRQAKE